VSKHPQKGGLTPLCSTPNTALMHIRTYSQTHLQSARPFSHLFCTIIPFIQKEELEIFRFPWSAASPKVTVAGAASTEHLSPLLHNLMQRDNPPKRSGCPHSPPQSKKIPTPGFLPQCRESLWIKCSSVYPIHVSA